MLGKARGDGKKIGGEMAGVGGVPSIFYTVSLIYLFPILLTILGISACSIGLLTTLYLNVSSPFLPSSVIVST